MVCPRSGAYNVEPAAGWGTLCHHLTFAQRSGIITVAAQWPMGAGRISDPGDCCRSGGIHVLPSSYSKSSHAVCCLDRLDARRPRSPWRGDQRQIGGHAHEWSNLASALDRKVLMIPRSLAAPGHPSRVKPTGMSRGGSPDNLIQY